MPVYKYLDLSTGHLPISDREKLLYGVDHLIIHEGSSNWWIHVPGHLGELEEMIEKNAAQHPDDRLSDHFINLLQHAAELNCFWINLDQDAEREDGLPWFEDSNEVQNG